MSVFSECGRSLGLLTTLCVLVQAEKVHPKTQINNQKIKTQTDD
jgi:hypothetical protein